MTIEAWKAHPLMASNRALPGLAVLLLKGRVDLCSMRLIDECWRSLGDRPGVLGGISDRGARRYCLTY